MDSKSVLIVGLDIGNSRTKVCFKLPNDTAIKEIAIWTEATHGVRLQSPTVSSSIYYPLSATVPVFAKDIENEMLWDDYDAKRLVSNWKSGLQPGSYAQEGLIAQSKFLEIDINRFAFDIVRLLLNHLFFSEYAIFKTIMRAGPWSLDQVCLVFGKPSGWQTSAYLEFQNAAKDVGFSPHQVRFVSETEAFLREYLKVGDGLNSEDIVVSCDCGGYTVDIDAHKIVQIGNSNKAIRVAPAGILPLSLPYGSETVWPFLERHIRKLLEKYNDYSEDEIQAILNDILPQWTWKIQAARNISAHSQQSICFKLRKMIRKDHKRDPPWEDDKLFIRWQTVIDIYRKESIIPIVDALRNFIDKLSMKPSRVVYGGGYCELSLVKDNFLELGTELGINFTPHPDHKPVANGAVDMVSNRDLVESRLLKSSYSIISLYPWSVKDEKSNPRKECKPYKWNGMWVFKGYEWLGKMGDKIYTNQVLTGDDEDRIWRERSIEDLDDLRWPETIQAWPGPPDSNPWTLPAKLAGLQPIETIALNVDFRNALSNFSVLLEKWPSKKGVFVIKYCVELHLDGETLTFMVKARDKEHKIHVLHLDERGTLDYVIENGDCPSNLEERRSHLSSSTLTEGSTTTSAGDEILVDPLTPTPSDPKQCHGFRKPPCRNRNKPERFQEPVSATPTEPRPRNLTSIGLPRLIEDLSL